jgi:hypothetical protein
MHSFKRWAFACGAAALAASPAAAWAKGKKHAAAAPQPQATAQTARAIGELAGKFKWGLSPDEAKKVVLEDVTSRYDERIRKEQSAFKQDALRQELQVALDKVKASYVKFDGQKTGWDVSLVDHEFAHRNDESMLVIWEKDQRRFLFFHDERLWKQFIAFNAEHPAFQGKTFDDFAALIQKRYGPAAMTFRKLRTSDEQTLDHLEWAPSGDNVLWAIDETTFYGNFCLSLMQKSALADVERGRKAHGVGRPAGSALVDQVLKGERGKPDTNEDIVDEITGRSGSGPSPLDEPSSPSSSTRAPAKDKPAQGEAPPPRDTADPLEGTKF